MNLFKVLGVWFIALVIHSHAIFAQECGQSCSCSWDEHLYLKLGTGYSFSRKAQVHAPAEIWDLAVEGYDNDLGGAPIIAAGIGYDIGQWLSTDIMFSYRPGYKYRKFQIGIPDPRTPGFIMSNRVRRFHLDVTTVMWNVYANGRFCKDYLCWNMGCMPGDFYPVLGAGIGMSRFKIFDFRSTGLPSVDATGIPAFGVASEYCVSYHFTYQLTAGLEYNYCDRWAICLGYRWFDAGKFKGPRYVRTALGHAHDFGQYVWDMRLRTHEVLLEVKFFL